MMTLIKKTSSGVMMFFDKFSADNTFSMAAALAFYAALSLAPLLILFVTLASQVNHSLQDNFVEEATALIGARAGEVIRMIINAAKDRSDLKGFSGTIGLVTLAVSASAVFGELKNSLNLILAEAVEGEKPKESNFVWTFLKQRILNIGLVLSFLFILLISLILSSVISFYAPHTDALLARLLNWIFSFGIQFGLFALLYRYVPDRGRNWRHASIAGGITAVLFTIGKEAVGFYIGRSALASAYGAAGSIIILLIWLYYSSLIVFSGAQVSELIMESREAQHG